MLFEDITEEQSTKITSIFTKHMYMMQQEVYRDTDLDLSRIQVIKGMIKLFCQNNVRDRKEVMGYTIYQLCGH